MAVLVVVAVMALLVILAAAGSRALAHLRDELRLTEAKQHEHWRKNPARRPPPAAPPRQVEADPRAVRPEGRPTADATSPPPP